MDLAWHGIGIGMCVLPRLMGASCAERHTGRGMATGSDARVRTGTAFCNAAPPCQTRGVGEFSLAFYFGGCNVGECSYLGDGTYIVSTVCTGKSLYYR